MRIRSLLPMFAIASLMLAIFLTSLNIKASEPIEYPPDGYWNDDTIRFDKTDMLATIAEDNIDWKIFPIIEQNAKYPIQGRGEEAFLDNDTTQAVFEKQNKALNNTKTLTDSCLFPFTLGQMLHLADVICSGRKTMCYKCH